MRKLTKKRVIKNFRKKWYKISKKTIKQKEKYNNKFFKEKFLNDRSCCIYAILQAPTLHNICEFCPIEWFSECNSFKCINQQFSGDNKGLYKLWETAENWKEAAELAEIISKLPEKM